MANLLNKSFLTSQIPSLCFKRFRGKINIQRPRAPHYERARVIAVTNPIYPKKQRFIPCKRIIVSEVKEQTENKYETIIAREVINWFDHSQMVGILHINSIKGEDYFNAKVAFHKNGMQLKKYGSSIMKKAVKDTKYEAVLKICETKILSTGFVFSTEHKKVDAILKILKKFPQMILLSGIVENQLMSRNEFIKYSQLPSLDIARSQLVNVLNMAGSNLVQNLSAHQASLVNILDAHVRESEKAKTKVDEPTSESPESS